jgi:hypothetical protein
MTPERFAEIKAMLYQEETEHAEILNDVVDELATAYAQVQGRIVELERHVSESQLRTQLAAVVEALSDMIDLADGLNEDDEWYGERRDALARIQRAREARAKARGGE